MSKKILAYPGGMIPMKNVMYFAVDATNAFTPLCPDELPVPDGDKIVYELNRLSAYAFFHGCSKDAHSRHAKWIATKKHPQLEPIFNEPDMDMRWNRHSVVGEFGHQLIAGLPHMREYDFWVTKGTEPDMHPYGACYQDLAKTISTGLIEWAKINGVKVFLIGGLAFEYCVKETVLELLAAGFIVILNLAATRGLDEKNMQLATEEMRSRGAIIIKDVSELQLVDV